MRKSAHAELDKVKLGPYVGVTESDSDHDRDEDPESEVTEDDEDGDQEFAVDAIKWAVYKDSRKKRPDGFKGWHYGVMWKGYLKTASDTEEPFSSFNQDEDDGQPALMSEFWESVGKHIPKGRKEPPGRIDEVVETPAETLKSWFRMATPKRDYETYRRRREKERQGLPLTKADSDYYWRKKKKARKAARRTTEGTPVSVGGKEPRKSPYKGKGRFIDPSPAPSFNSLFDDVLQSEAGPSKPKQPKTQKRQRAASSDEEEAPLRASLEKKKQKKAKETDTAKGKGKGKGSSKAALNPKVPKRPPVPAFTEPLRRSLSSQLSSLSPSKSPAPESTRKRKLPPTESSTAPVFGTPDPNILAPLPLETPSHEPLFGDDFSPGSSPDAPLSTTTAARKRLPTESDDNDSVPPVAAPKEAAPSKPKQPTKVAKPERRSGLRISTGAATSSSRAQLNRDVEIIDVSSSPEAEPVKLPKVDQQEDDAEDMEAIETDINPPPTAVSLTSAEPASTEAVQNVPNTLPPEPKISVAITSLATGKAPNVPPTSPTPSTPPTPLTPPPPTPPTPTPPTPPPGDGDTVAEDSAPPASNPVPPTPNTASDTSALVPPALTPSTASEVPPYEPPAKEATSTSAKLPPSQRPKYQQPKKIKAIDIASDPARDPSARHLDPDGNPYPPAAPEGPTPTDDATPTSAGQPTSPTSKRPAFVPRQKGAQAQGRPLPPLIAAAHNAPQVGRRVPPPFPSQQTRFNQQSVQPGRPPAAGSRSPGSVSGHSTPNASFQPVGRSPMGPSGRFSPHMAIGNTPIRQDGRSPFWPAGGQTPMGVSGGISPHAGGMSPTFEGGSISPAVSPNNRWSRRGTIRPDGWSPLGPLGGQTPMGISGGMSPPAGGMSPIFEGGSRSPDVSPQRQMSPVNGQAKGVQWRDGGAAHSVTHGDDAEHVANPQPTPLAPGGASLPSSGASTPAAGALSNGATSRLGHMVLRFSNAKLPKMEIDLGQGLVKDPSDALLHGANDLQPLKGFMFDELETVCFNMLIAQDANVSEWAPVKMPSTPDEVKKVRWLKGRLQHKNVFYLCTDELVLPGEELTSHRLLAIMLPEHTNLPMEKLKSLDPYSGVLVVVIDVPFKSKPIPSLPNPVRPDFASFSEAEEGEVVPVQKQTSPITRAASIAESYGLNEVTEKLLSRPIYLVPDCLSGTKMYEVLKEKFDKSGSSAPQPGRVPSKLLILNGQWSAAVSRGTFHRMLDRRAQFLSMGHDLYSPVPHWSLRPIWETGGLVTFSPTLILREPAKVLEIMAAIRFTPDWAAYITPATILWCEQSWKKPARCPDPDKAYATLTNELYLVDDNLSLERKTGLAVSTAPPELPKREDCTKWTEWLRKIWNCKRYEDLVALCEESYRQSLEDPPAAGEELDLFLNDIEREALDDLSRMRVRPHILPYRRYLYVGQMSISQEDRVSHGNFIEMVSADDFGAVLSGAV